MKSEARIGVPKARKKRASKPLHLHSAQGRSTKLEKAIDHHVASRSVKDRNSSPHLRRRGRQVGHVDASSDAFDVRRTDNANLRFGPRHEDKVGVGMRIITCAYRSYKLE